MSSSCDEESPPPAEAAMGSRDKRADVRRLASWRAFHPLTWMGWQSVEPSTLGG
jgi:hypothetical protein